MKKIIGYLVFISFILACQQTQPLVSTLTSVDTKRELPPNERFGELFEAVQLNQVFEDGKTFVDCRPKQTTDEIMTAYNQQKGAPNFDLSKFVHTHFDLPIKYASGFEADTSKEVTEHINVLWDVLTRQPDQEDVGSLFPLPKSYIVPGGRFGEIYYWDSYFTMLGLQVAGKTTMVENMLDNFAYLIDKIGFIPNGNRTYFLSRSQPPFFAKMVALLAASKGEQTFVKYLPQLEKEYAFWMKSLPKVNATNKAVGKVVMLEEGVYLNRYWDKGDYPRAESYREDIETIEKSNRPAKVVYKDLRAACESGWDFSSRWLSDAKELHNIHTTDIIPVDLNTLLYDLEIILAKAYEISGKTTKATEMEGLAQNRRAAIQKYCWNSALGFYSDYDFVKAKHTPVFSLAGVFPLESKIATPSQALKATQFISDNFLKPGGVVTTLNATGQQWDYPNGWAPLQWMTIKGLRNYKQYTLADNIAERWIALNNKVYKKTGKLLEKYNVVDLTLESGGGEYPVQDGFGWTNGVLLKLLEVEE